ncbi:uncharacterized protein M6B38_313215 [Iris pallida]|uniref:Uncharacterized protein n=1 Tax=Iris pallida TaxID=29817 RepID=A0AAX6HGL5_IRIPA|nr:uncharacterized protein M6B38_313215 [Iris pallida]
MAGPSPARPCSPLRGAATAAESNSSNGDKPAVRALWQRCRAAATPSPTTCSAWPTPRWPGVPWRATPWPSSLSPTCNGGDSCVLHDVPS